MISPWNFPVNLSFGPLAAIFAAGNQVMHKPSELTPLTASLIKDLCDKAFDENEFATFLVTCPQRSYSKHTLIKSSKEIFLKTIK